MVSKVLLQATQSNIQYLINDFKSFIDIYKNKITQQMKHNAAAINIAGI